MPADVSKTEKVLSCLEDLRDDVANKMDALTPPAKVIKEAYELSEPFLENVAIFASIIKDIGEVCCPRLWNTGTIY